MLFKCPQAALCSLNARSLRGHFLIRQLSTNKHSRNQNRASFHTNKLRNNDELKFDPTRPCNSFIENGVLPFFQKNLNGFLRVRDSRSNAIPSNDQKLILSVLHSNNNLILKGAAQSGKSLSILMYALQISLAKKPNHGIKKMSAASHKHVDSIIIVPTNEMVEKYKYFAQKLTQNLPKFCCPEEFVQSESNGESKTDVKRVPLSILFKYSDARSNESYSSDTNEKEGLAHILITTSSILEGMLISNKTKTKRTDRLLLNDLKFVAVDDVDYQISCSNIDGNFNFSRIGDKGKYISKTERCIRALQDLHSARYADELKGRLKQIEDEFKVDNEIVDNNFTHWQFVMENNFLTKEYVDKNISETFKLVPELESPNLSLLKKLIKHRRKLLYKSIQYCFVCQPRSNFRQLIEKLSNDEKQLLIPDKYMFQNGKVKSLLDSQLLSKVSSYISEKSAVNESSDVLNSFIEKLIMLDDSKKVLSKRERRIISVENNSLNSESLVDQCDSKDSDETFHGIDAYITEASCEGKGNRDLTFKDVDINKKLPSKLQAVNEIKSSIKSSKNNLKNIEKKFLKEKMESNALLSNKANLKQGEPELQFIIMLDKYIDKFNSTVSKHPVLIVAPPNLNSKKISDLLQNNQMINNKFTTFDDIKTLDNIDFDKMSKFFETSTSPNLIVHPHNLIGQNFSMMQNILISGLDCLIPQLALTSWKSSNIERNIKDITGVEYPEFDLLLLYINKLHSSSPKGAKKTITLLVDNRNKKDKRITKLWEEKDLKKLGELMVRNELHEIVNVKQAFEKKRVLNYSSDLKNPFM